MRSFFIFRAFLGSADGGTSILLVLLIHSLLLLGISVESFSSRPVSSFAVVSAYRKSRYPLFMAQSFPTEKRVVYQKIVRPPKDCPPVLLLGNLVEYLQGQFSLPANLPMVYEQNSSDDSESPFVLSWDSPLSSSSAETQLNVEVVGIYTEEERSPGEKENQSLQSSVPNMAMVVVSKTSTEPGNILAPMMKNLFDDSEKRIVEALDRGMDNFCNGKIKLSENGFTEAERPDNVQNVEEAIQAELVDNVPESKERVAPEDVIIETTTTPEVESEPNVPNKVKRTENRNKSANAFEVQAAKREAALKSMNQNTKETEKFSSRNASTEDFAVRAAKQAAKMRKQANMESTPKATPVQNDTPLKFTAAQSQKERISSSRPMKSRFRTTISIPSKKKGKPSTLPNEEKELRNGKKEGQNDGAAAIVVDGEEENVISSEPEAGQRVSSTKKRAINMRVNSSKHLTNLMQMEDEQQSFDKMLEDANKDNAKPGAKAKITPESSSPKRTVSKEQMERDVLETAQNVMSEIADQGKEMTPEELLEDVLKFGKEKDKEESEGFVSAAFEKAKELLREQNQKNQQKKHHDLGFEEPNTKTDSDEENTFPKELTAEEELKQIFEAGQRLADGRLAFTNSEATEEMAVDEGGTTEEDVARLIASEKSISGYARQLDDELAELELQITKSPGEELDGPRENPIFDVMSGPEVYNPNVDPETAVNWPGALPGTKEVRLPKELNEAVSQAKFASGILTTLVEKETNEEGGEIKKQYFIGEKELTQEQVDNLRRCVAEAVRVGLIDDPIVYMSEQSRLQMLVDELLGQPEERFQDIISNYKDLLLSENFVSLVKERLTHMVDRDLDAKRRSDDSLEGPHAMERQVLGILVNQAQILLKETRALGAELEAAQLEIVRQICQVAMDPSHKTEEETSNALTDAVRDMRPMFDDMFVAYLKYAVAEEEGRLARAGLLDDPEHNQWLFVLQIVQQGVYAELSRGISRYIDHIGYVLRMDSHGDRRGLLEKFIDDLPTMDVRPFVQVVDNIASGLGDSVRGDFDPRIGDMTNKLLQLHRDVHTLLPPERIKLMSRDADEWAANQKRRLVEARKVTQQRLKAARETQEYDEDTRQRGEMERMT